MGVSLTNYYYSPEVLYPVESAEPGYVDYELVVTSDISGKDITDEEVWMLDDGTICSKDEMFDEFIDRFVTKVPDYEYEKAKKSIIDSDCGYTEEDFKDHPELIKIQVDKSDSRDPVYDFADDFYSLMFIFTPKDWTMLTEEELNEMALKEYEELRDSGRNNWC